MSRRKRPGTQPATGPWSRLRPAYDDAADILDELTAANALNDVDHARIAGVLSSERADVGSLAKQISAHGAAAGLHRSGLRDLPGTRTAQHNLVHGQVRIGRTVPMKQAPAVLGDDFGIDHDVLRTSLLVIGPPGSGKTRGFALPIVEHLALSALSLQASVVVVDPKGDDFDFPGWFDVTIDPLAPSAGFDLFGGADEPDTAADRLASALLPPQVSDDLAFFMDASRNALYACLAPFHQAFERWPTIKELLALLRVEQGMTDRVKGALRGHGSKEAKQLLETRGAQSRARHDPSASMVERLALLDRPRLTKLFDAAEPKFHMHQINDAARVRVALPEAEFPDASRILARLVVSQFVQVCSSASSNRDIFKGLVIDEAGRFVDDYVARGVQKLRSNNAGVVLLAQTISDFPDYVRATVFGSVGCKAIFAGVDPSDAEVFSQWFGEEWISEVTVSRGVQSGSSQSRGWSHDGIVGGGWRRQRGRTESSGTSSGASIRRVERAKWTQSDIVTGIPFGHCVVALSRSDGTRTGPVLLNLRA